MNKLFLDIGNSQLKWASVVDGEYLQSQSIALNRVIDSQLDCLNLESIPDEVYFSTVGKPQLVDNLKLLIQTVWQVLPVQLTSQQTCCGLKSGYEDFSALGDDRWFAMLGAIGVYDTPVIVIDAGTALTIDSVIDGQHKGGFIVPGLSTLRTSLANSTADLSDFSQSSTEGLNDIDKTDGSVLAVDTKSAILGGTLYMTAAFINQVVSDLNHQFSTQFKLIVTGGDAKVLASLIDSQFDYIPDLVLQGMVNVEESIKKQ